MSRGVSELKVYDPAAVRERYGIEPYQYPEIAALVGETSDNLIGIDKVGEKTAVKWVQQYGTVDEIVAHADEIKGVVGQNLRDQKENALRNRRLNKLLTDVELPVGPADLERRPINEKAVRDIFGQARSSRPSSSACSRRRPTRATSTGRSAPTRRIETGALTASRPSARWSTKSSRTGWPRASADGAAIGVQVELGHGRHHRVRPRDAADDTVYVPWAPGRPDYQRARGMARAAARRSTSSTPSRSSRR